MKRKIKFSFIAVMLSVLTISNSALATTIKLRIIETADLQANMMDFDYHKGKIDPKIGLVRAATLIEAAKKEADNSVLVDNGDVILGSPMGFQIAEKGIKPKEIHPAYKAMNLLKYDIANIGNREFNYGLPFLFETINDAAFPYINANLFDAKTGKHAFTPYVIKKYKFIDTMKRFHNVSVGYIGFAPPQVVTWDKKHLKGKLIAKDIVETAQKLVPLMKAKGAEIIIAIPHSGLSNAPYRLMSENVVYHLADVKGIDAIAFGHSHSAFPHQNFADLPNIDNKKGTIKGIAAVAPSREGKHIGIIDLELKKQLGKWEVVPIQSEVKPIFANKSVTKPNLALRKALQQDHKKTRQFFAKPIGKTKDAMYSFLALVQDDPTIQIVNLAQKDYVERFIQDDPNLANIPVLSSASPFKVGGRKDDPSNYTAIDIGSITFHHITELYPSHNNLVALKVTGSQLNEWLECSAGQFNQIDPNSSKKQSLINWDGFRPYNFDVIDGINYQINVTKPARYDGKCQLINFSAGRIENLTYKGKPVDPKQLFLVASNNTRAYLDLFPGTGKEHIAFVSPNENHTILIDYIRRKSKEKGFITPAADNNWSFAPIKTKKKLNIQFETSPSKKAASFIATQAQYPMKIVKRDDTGFSLYQIDLTKKNNINKAIK